MSESVASQECKTNVACAHALDYSQFYH